MAFSKARLFHPQDQFISRFSRTLAHPARIDILRTLLNSGPQTLQDLNELHPISQPATSDHVKILHTFLLVKYKEKYPHIIYDVNRKRLKESIEALISYLLSFDLSD